jgi:hypothetical protein
MTYDELLKDCNIIIKNSNHERVVRLFYAYLSRVCGDAKALPNMIGEIVGVDFSDTTARTGCFNGVFDETEPPYQDVDFYIRFENDIRVFVYGSIRGDGEKELKNNEYVIFAVGDRISGHIIRSPSRHIYLAD